jgi:hypothetical protein
MSYAAVFSDIFPPLWGFQKLTQDQFAELQERLEQESSKEEEEKDFLRCKRCGNKITSLKYMIPINGLQQHTFSNPYGIVFEISCFSMAEGCINAGAPTTEFTWFSGYSWRFAFCAKCQTHLGWFYQSKGWSSFYGLILDQLAEG